MTNARIEISPFTIIVFIIIIIISIIIIIVIIIITIIIITIIIIIIIIIIISRKCSLVWHLQLDSNLVKVLGFWSYFIISECWISYRDCKRRILWLMIILCYYFFHLKVTCGGKFSILLKVLVLLLLLSFIDVRPRFFWCAEIHFNKPKHEWT